MFYKYLMSQIEQWYIDFLDENRNTVAEEYITCTFPEAEEQAEYILSTLTDATAYSIRALRNI